MEVLLRDFSSDAFPAVVAASATAAVVSALLHPSAHLAATAQMSGRPLADLALACVPAVLCGAAGSVYMRSISMVERWTRGRRGPRWAWAAVGGLAAGALGCLVPEVLGTGDPVIAAALTGQSLGLHGAAAAGAKIVATAATLGSGGSGGAFMPAMFIGSALGAGCRGLLHRVFSIEAPRGLFALAGMSCALTSAYRAPMTAIVLALEVAHGPEVMGPVMLAVALAHLLSRGDSERRVVSE
jgi:CIC family chloride channel protein